MVSIGQGGEVKRKAVAAVGTVAVLGASLVAAGIATAGESARSADTVDVTLGTAKKNDPTEFRIYSAKLKSAQFGKASILKGGSTTFNVTNASGEKFPHNITVVAKSAGGSQFASKTLAGGASQAFTVTLKPGAYVLVCTVFNGAHWAEGMLKSFTVGTQDGKTGRWK
jgi:plastocyanin